MHVAVLQPLVGHWPGNLAPWALLLLLKACGISTKLAVPVHADKAVVKDRFCTGYGSSGFFILCVLDQCCLWVSAKHNLDWECTCKSVNVLNSFSCRPNLYELCGEHSLKKSKTTTTNKTGCILPVYWRWFQTCWSARWVWWCCWARAGSCAPPTLCSRKKSSWEKHPYAGCWSSA